MNKFYSARNALKNNLAKIVYLASEKPLFALNDKPPTLGSSYLIPNVVYQTWETRKLPKTLASSVSGFRALNPGLGFYLYDNQQLDEFMHSAFPGTEILGLYNRLTYGPSKADLFRYCILYERGGYYFDINKMCDIPLQSAHRSDHTALLSFENNLVRTTPSGASARFIKHPERLFLQWGLGFTKGHRILEISLQLIAEHAYMFAGKMFSEPKKAILAFSGPGLFTKAVWSYFEERGGQDQVCQLGVDFDGHGIFEANGSWARKVQVPHYGLARNATILS